MTTDATWRTEAASTAERADLALYLHIPFCTTKCGYCDFNSYEGIEHLAPEYNAALLREIELWSPAARTFNVRTVFFGGGTPSLTELAALVLDALRPAGER